MPAVFVLALVGLLVLGPAFPARADGERPPTAAGTRPERTPAVIAAGREVYVAHCLKCHGPEGKGDGPERGEAIPRPRDFTKRRFKYVSTLDKSPSAEDLFRVVSRGLPGTTMTALQETLPESDRWAVIYYVQELAALDPEPDPLVLPARPPVDRALLKTGFKTFLAQCAKCHGPKGRGDGVAADSLKDVDGNTILPRDLVEAPLRGGEEPEQLFCRVKLGLPGTPMEPPEAFATLSDEQIWAVVEYIRSLRKS